MNRQISEESNKNYSSFTPLQKYALKSFMKTTNVGNHKLTLTIRNEN